MTLKVRILQFLTTFTQLTARLKNILRVWLLLLSLKESLVECTTVCVKSEVILIFSNLCVYFLFQREEPLFSETQIANFKSPNLHKHLENACKTGTLVFQGRDEYSVRVQAAPCRLSFFKIWSYSAEFHITHMYSIYKYLAKMMLLSENLPLMAEFFNPHQKLCQGTNN